MNEYKWYVIRVVSGQEKKVKSYIETESQRQDLQDYLPQVLIPSEKVYEMRNGKKRVRERNYFPGYVLLSADLSHGEMAPFIKSVPSVIGFLSEAGGGDPVPLRQSEVNRILGKVDEVEASEQEVEAPYIVGEQIKVMDGPFSGFTGVIEEVSEERKKLKVVVKIFGRNTPVELNYMQVEKQD
ncbi:transcription termination/antitermination protein NusG [Aureibacter tunicatorum]|uniref:Transcription termination/antitermination protein NusG n=1 Tax=Aureibacter tunicatorum TaxID=866807 RepID=A0AAE3XMV9_9BACT|nr:transcription termination/antitermination protein NusG [Aureibacter tunicatorum]MDR6237949.1 transcriptional antiterminator NusG [Aureibacter tunicatorum]BDD02982.1 transcription termination/antitermination protein NusG [Aureibacter tunicatorum]